MKVAARAAAAAAQRSARQTWTLPPPRPRWWKPTGAGLWTTPPRSLQPLYPCQPCWPSQPWPSTDNGDNVGGTGWTTMLSCFCFLLFCVQFFDSGRLELHSSRQYSGCQSGGWRTEKEQSYIVISHFPKDRAVPSLGLTCYDITSPPNTDANPINSASEISCTYGRY